MVTCRIRALSKASLSELCSFLCFDRSAMDRVGKVLSLVGGVKCVNLLFTGLSPTFNWHSFNYYPEYFLLVTFSSVFHFLLVVISFGYRVAKQV